MITILGFAMVGVFMTLIMSGRMTPLTALIVVPIAFGLLAGHGAGLGPMMAAGVTKIAPTAVMLMFAILYFGLMGDVGLFDPLIRRLVALVQGDPLRVSMGAVALAALVSLDGDGSTTYVITAAAMLPLYERLGMNRLQLVCLLMLTSGVMNLTPWGGPTARAAAALGVDAGDIFVPLLPAMAGGLLFLLALAWRFGRAERARLGVLDAPPPAPSDMAVGSWRYAFNAALTITLLVLLVWGPIPLPILMMGAFALALVVNAPGVAEQKARIASHAGNVLAVTSVIFAAGVFTGILSGTGMIDAMAHTVTDALPPAVGPYLAPITAALSLPFTFFISNDAFYFGVLPVLAKAAAAYGITPVEIARASLMGQPFHLLSPLVPSTYLLVTLAGVELGAHQRFTAGWAVLTGLAMAAAAIAVGAFPLVR